MSRGPSSYNFSILTLETWKTTQQVSGSFLSRILFFWSKKNLLTKFQKLASERNFDHQPNKAIFRLFSLSDKNTVR